MRDPVLDVARRFLRKGVLAGDLARKAGKDSRAVRVAENRVEEEDQDGRQDPGVT